MKSSLRALQGLASVHRRDPKETRGHKPSVHQEDLAQASQDMIDMRNCYDSLLSAAAATANSAYEFSEALREMGNCLLERTPLGDEESGRVLLMLGEAQFELQKLVDSYRVHIIQTITTPSESLVKELETVEEMKRQCDDKRDLCKFMLTEHKKHGRSRNTTGENFSSQQIQAANENYEDEATMFLFRIKSLKQGQSRSLLTQAARHHAAQLSFFRKGVKSLEVVEPQVKVVAAQQHIDYQFSGLEDEDSTDDYSDAQNGNYDGDLSFDYGGSNQVQDIDSTSKSMELDQVSDMNAPTSTSKTAKENLDWILADKPPFRRVITAGTQSAPILTETKLEPSERINQMLPSTRKFDTYVLPTPVDVKNSALTNDKAQSVLKESNINSNSTSLPPPLAEGLRFKPDDVKRTKRQSFSGPMASKAWPSRPMFSFMPPAKKSEPHELPRPPTGLQNPRRNSSLIGHSAPLMSKNQELNAPHKATPLPTPPVNMARSFSIPSVVKVPYKQESTDDLSSSMTPISLTKIIRPILEASGSTVT